MPKLSPVTGFALSFLISYIPLMSSLRDPFDEVISYSFWIGGLLILTIVMIVSQPNQTWKCTVLVALGFPAAVIANMLLKAGSYQLPPLTVILSLIIGMTASSLGAIIGKHLRELLKARKQEKRTG